MTRTLTTAGGPMREPDGPIPDPDDPGGLSDMLTSGLGDAIESFFRRLVEDALNPLLDLLGQTLLTTPELDEVPRVAELWEQSRLFVAAAYVLVVLIGAIVVMGHETVQTRHGVKEILPRLVVGFLAANLSLLLLDKAIGFANALSASVLGAGMDPDDAAAALSDLVLGSLSNDHGVFLILIGLVVAVMLIVLLVVYVVRVAVTFILIAAAPLALACYGLPQTEGIARWWCRAMAAVLAIQLGQSLALVTFLRVFLDPDGFTLFGGATSDGVVNLLVCMALFYVLIKIPFWALAQLRTSDRRGLVGGLVRGFIAYKTFGLLRGGTTAMAARRGGSGGTTGQGPRPPSSPSPHGGRRPGGPGRPATRRGGVPPTTHGDQGMSARTRRPRPAQATLNTQVGRSYAGEVAGVRSRDDGHRAGDSAPSHDREDQSQSQPQSPSAELLAASADERASKPGSGSGGDGKAAVSPRRSYTPRGRTSDEASAVRRPGGDQPQRAVPPGSSAPRRRPGRQRAVPAGQAVRPRSTAQRPSQPERTDADRRAASERARRPRDTPSHPDARSVDATSGTTHSESGSEPAGRPPVRRTAARPVVAPPVRRLRLPLDLAPPPDPADETGPAPTRPDRRGAESPTRGPRPGVPARPGGRDAPRKPPTPSPPQQTRPGSVDIARPATRPTRKASPRPRAASTRGARAPSTTQPGGDDSNEAVAYAQQQALRAPHPRPRQTRRPDHPDRSDRSDRSDRAKRAEQLDRRNP